MSFRFLLMFLVMATLAPSYAHAKRASDFQTHNTASSASVLAHSEWTFTDMNGGKISLRKDLDIHFADAKRFTAVLCNNVAGTYAVKDGRLFVSRTDFSQTQILCNADIRATARNAVSVEHAILSCETGCRFTLHNHILKLSGKGDTTLKLIRKDWD